MGSGSLSSSSCCSSFLTKILRCLYNLYAANKENTRKKCVFSLFTIKIYSFFGTTGREGGGGTFGRGTRSGELDVDGKFLSPFAGALGPFPAGD
jgi:hypothetical protein